VWGCHFGLRTVPAPQFDALQGRARLLSAADSLFTSAGAFGACDAWLMPQSILQSQQLEQDAAAALASEGADLKALLEGIAKRSVELDALTGLDDVERAGAASATAVPLTAPAIAFAFNSLCSRCRKEAAAVCLRFPGVAAQGSQASALVTRIISSTGHHPASPQDCAGQVALPRQGLMLRLAVWLRAIIPRCEGFTSLIARPCRSAFAVPLRARLQERAC
jgi:hypothetical protein